MTTNSDLTDKTLNSTECSYCCGISEQNIKALIDSYGGELPQNLEDDAMEICPEILEALNYFVKP